MTDHAVARSLVKKAALDASRIGGLTHTFYRYPARFSPNFASACIDAYSKPGDLVIDPYMGGGTTVVEAMVAGRRSIGSDINELAAFVAKVKVSLLSRHDIEQLRHWSGHLVPAQRATAVSADSRKLKNMSLPEVRWLRKTMSVLLDSIENDIAGKRAQDFARCVILNVGQWALNGKKVCISSSTFRTRVSLVTLEMLGGIRSLSDRIKTSDLKVFKPIIRVNDAELIDRDRIVVREGLADLVVTSPPYPGVHMLYHRWQVDGRKETDAPYWITNRRDGAGVSYYNFADRKRPAELDYYVKGARTFASTRRLMAKGALLVQMVAFSEPKRQLPLYMGMMEDAGFDEVRSPREKRIWRAVPGRAWHASSKGETPSSREVVLVHEAV